MLESIDITEPPEMKSFSLAMDKAYCLYCIGDKRQSRHARAVRHGHPSVILTHMQPFRKATRVRESIEANDMTCH